MMDIVYKMDFSLPGFLLCAAILGFGTNEAFLLYCFDYNVNTSWAMICMDRTRPSSQFIVGIVHFMSVLIMLS